MRPQVMTGARRLLVVACLSLVVGEAVWAQVRAASRSNQQRPDPLLHASSEWMYLASYSRDARGDVPAAVSWLLPDYARVSDALSAELLKALNQGTSWDQADRDRVRLFRDTLVEAARPVTHGIEPTLAEVERAPPGWARDFLTLQLARRLGQSDLEVRAQHVILRRGGAIADSFVARKATFWTLVVLAGALALPISARRARAPRAIGAQRALAVYLYIEALLACATLALSLWLLPSLVERGNSSGVVALVRYWPVAVNCLALLAVCLLLFPHRARSDRTSPSTEMMRSSLGLVGIGALAAILILLGRAFIVTAYPAAPSLTSGLPVPEPSLFPSLASSLLLAPILEEILYRALLFAALRSFIGIGPAALVSAVVFSAMHTGSAFDHLVWLWSGIALAFVYHATERLVPCAVAHALVNMRELLAI